MSSITESVNPGAYGSHLYHNGSGQDINHGSGDQNINSGSGHFHVNNQGYYYSLRPAKRHARAPLKHTSELDKIRAVDRPMDRSAAREDLKEVEQRLKANYFLDWKGDKAQRLLDQFHRASEVTASPTRERVLEKMKELSKKSNRLPNCSGSNTGSPSSIRMR